MNKTKRRTVIGMLMFAGVLLAGCNVNVNIMMPQSRAETAPL